MNKIKVSIFFKYLHNLSETGFFFENALYESVQYILDIKKSSQEQFKIIDFGCGQKPLKYLFDPLKGQYLGLDVYPGKQVDIVYDGLKIPLEENSVDLVFSSSVFEHVQDLDWALKEIYRILKPEGQLLAVVPFTNHVHGTPFDYHRPTRYGWEYRFKETFGKNVNIHIYPVDNRLSCLINLITAQINNFILDFMRAFQNCF